MVSCCDYICDTRRSILRCVINVDQCYYVFRVLSGLVLFCVIMYCYSVLYMTTSHMSCTKKPVPYVKIFMRGHIDRLSEFL